MDKKFHPAIEAIKAGDIDELKSLIGQDPTLATGRSSRSHPTLLQCLALDAQDVPNQVEMARVLIDAGAEINGPLGACASGDNVEVAAALLDAGALINGPGTWSPLEEALYWSSDGVRDLLLERGASVHNLRIAAGLGRVDLIERFFDSDGMLKPGAGRIDWPFGELEKCNLPAKNKGALQARIAAWSHDSQSIINNAFLYTCIHNHVEAAKLLLKRGAQIDAIPPGFHYAGSGLHYAAYQGHRQMIEFLVEQGADATIKDPESGGVPADWARHKGHKELADFLDQAAKAQSQAKM